MTSRSAGDQVSMLTQEQDVVHKCWIASFELFSMQTQCIQTVQKPIQGKKRCINTECTYQTTERVSLHSPTVSASASSLPVLDVWRS